MRNKILLSVFLLGSLVSNIEATNIKVKAIKEKEFMKLENTYLNTREKENNKKILNEEINFIKEQANNKKKQAFIDLSECEISLHKIIITTQAAETELQKLRRNITIIKSNILQDMQIEAFLDDTMIETKEKLNGLEMIIEIYLYNSSKKIELQNKFKEKLQEIYSGKIDLNEFCIEVKKYFHEYKEEQNKIIDTNKKLKPTLIKMQEQIQIEIKRDIENVEKELKSKIDGIKKIEEQIEILKK